MILAKICCTRFLFIERNFAKFRIFAQMEKAFSFQPQEDDIAQTDLDVVVVWLPGTTERDICAS
jgi:hypothetical protein